MRRTIAPFILLYLLVAGCDTEQEPDDILAVVSYELTDGYCLTSGDRVVLNHEDIEYYDHGAHLIYLKNHRACSEVLGDAMRLSVYAGGDEIYTVTTQPGHSSLAPDGPIIWTAPLFYPENVIAIDLVDTYETMIGTVQDPREDPRIEEALKKYNQYREGLHGEISSVWYENHYKLGFTMELTNRDPVNYYYLDPEKMGIDLFHYFTNGVTLWDTALHRAYDAIVDEEMPDPWDAWDLDWMSVLEGGESTTITLQYDNFVWVPAGTFKAAFEFPGLQYQVDPEQLNQTNGRLWLGKLRLNSMMEVQ